jgi:hypothetical protein
MTSISSKRRMVFRKPSSVPGVPTATPSKPSSEQLNVEAMHDENEFSPPTDADVEKPLFESDTSTLPYDVRRAYAVLLRGPSLDERHSKLWPVLIAHEGKLRQLLNAAFLDLVVDLDQKVAFTRPVHAPELDVPQLLREVRLTFLETALILFLRLKLTQAAAEGERATVSRAELVEHLKAYEASDNVDHSRFGRQIEGAIEKSKRYNFLRQIRNASDRFEIAPTLRLVFSHEQVNVLLKTYREIPSGAAGQGVTPVESVGPVVDDFDDDGEDN